MNRLLIRLGALTLALVGLAALPAGSAQAAVPSGPTAVAISANGTTYVGNAAGGSLTRIDATGAVMSPIALPRTGPVDGLAIDPDGVNIWVSYGYGASEISPSGTELAFINTLASPGDCTSTDANDPSTYGGIVATTDRIVLTHRCGASIGLNTYARSDLQARGGASAWNCTGDCRYGDIAFSTQTSTQAPQGSYFVTIPGKAKVEVWTGFDNVHGSPLRTIDVDATRIQANFGGVTARPTGVAVDDQGQVFVTDAANHVIYVYNNGGQQYDRYIGNPPDPDSYVGGFNLPSAVAQYPRTGSISEFQGNLFVADTNNNRIERLNTYGYAFWAAPTDGSPSTPGSPPINQNLPTVTGTPAVGQTLTCDRGDWAGAPTSYTYGWNRDNGYLSGESATTYVVKSGDAGHKISCFVQAQNAAGTSGYATSANVTIASTPPADSAPVYSIRPTISGTPQPGATLTCSNGTWSGSPAPTFTRQWLLDGTPIAGATSSSYTVLDSDLGHQLACVVTATNSQGSASAQSAPVTVTSSTPPSPCPGPAGVSINSAAPYTTSADVSLRIRPPAGATQVLISNDGGFDSASVRAISADCLYAWSLTGSSSRDAKVVYVRFAGGGVNELTQLSDDIILDTNAPALPRPAVTRVSRGSKTFKVSLKASDKTTKVAKVQYAATKGGTGHTVGYRATFRTTTPAKFTWVRVFDQAGNHSAWKKSRR